MKKCNLDSCASKAWSAEGKGACGADGGLEVFCQPSIAPDPGEEPLDDPTPRVDGEADLIGVLAHDLDRDQRRRGDLFAGISAVGEDALDEREDAPRDSQKRSATIPVLDTRRMRFEHEAAPVRVHERMALTSVDLLSGIVTACPAGLGGLDALASLSRPVMSSASLC